MKMDYTVFQGGKVVPDEAGDFYEVGLAGSPDFNLQRANMEFAKMLLRNLTLDSYEALFRYSKDTNQLAKCGHSPGIALHEL